MVFAVEEINRNTSLLPGVKLGYRIMDSCDHVHTSLRALMSLVSHSKAGMGELKQMVKTEKRLDMPKETLASCLVDYPVPAVIGLASSTPARAVAHTLGPFNIPLVSKERNIHSTLFLHELYSS